MSSIEKAMEEIRRLREQQGKPAHTSSHVESSQPPVQPARSDYRTKKFCEISDDFLRKNGYMTMENADTQMVEEYRVIKRPLLMHVAGKGADKPVHPNIIMVVSAVEGEGKTFTAMNLALSMAMEKNTTVLLVDCDVVKPALTTSLGLSGEPGLIDVLLDSSLSIADVMYKTSIPKLNLVPTGSQHSHATELLASQEMKHLCDELANRYSDRVIVFDAPPLLQTSHARVLSHLAGQIVLVTEAGKTTHHEITEAVSQFGKDKVVGMVLNKNRRMLGSEYTYGD